MKYIRLCLLFLFLTLPLDASAQSSEWKHYDPPNSQASGLTALAVTNYGTFWIGEGHLGVSAFDGSEWASYDMSDAPFSVGDLVTSLASSALNALWVGTYNEPYSGGLLHYDGHIWREYHTSNSDLPEDGITGVCLDNYGDIWVAGEDPDIGQASFVARFDSLSWTQYFTEQATGNSFGGLTTVDTIDCSNDGPVWIAVLSYDADSDSTLPSIVRYWEDEWTFTKSLPFHYDLQYTVTAIAGSDSVSAWIGTRNQGLHKFDGRTWLSFNTSNSELPSDEITSLAHGTDSTLWIGTHAGLASFDGLEWHTFNTDNSELPNNLVTKLAVDEFDNVWMISGDMVSTSAISVFQEGGLVNVGTTSTTTEFNRSPALEIYPNPFRMQTQIQVELIELSTVKIEVFDLAGRRVWRNLPAARAAGNHSIVFRAGDLPSGPYFVRASFGDTKVQNQMVLIR